MLKNLSIKYKNGLLVTLATLVAIFTGVLALSLTMETLYNERRGVVEGLVDVAHHIIGRKHQMYLDGELPSEAVAQQEAINALRAMKYGEDGYYFIYRRDGTSLMNGGNPKIEGRNMLAFEDPKGVRVIEELIKVSANGQGGNVDYHWDKPGSSEPKPKIGYAKGFVPWDWFVGTGIYAAEPDQELLALVKRNAGLVVLSSAFFVSLVVLLFTINGGVLRKVLMLQEHLASFAKGDFSRKIPDEGSDELGEMFHSMGQVQQSMQQTLGRLSDTVSSVGSDVEGIARSNQSLATRTEEQANNLAHSSNNLNRVAGMVRENSDSLVAASELAKQSQDTVVRGEQVIQQAIGAMSRITTSSDKVTEIINIINEIAFQTNLLALNAAVEAARAGDQGRGFAVVASEVRMLAQRSATSANEIKQLIEESAQNVKTGSELVSASGDLLKQILESSTQVGDLMNNISISTKEQAQGIESTSQAVGEVDAFVQENAAMVQEVAVSSSSLKAEISRLKEVVAYFETGASRVTEAQPDSVYSNSVGLTGNSGSRAFAT